MWTKFWQAGGHYITGLAVIGAIAALMAVGTVAAAVGVPVILGTGSLLIGGKLGATVPGQTSG